jgi:hypothetical protein
MGTGQLWIRAMEQDSWDRTGQPEERVRIVPRKKNSRQDGQNMTARTGQVRLTQGSDNCGRTVRIWHLGKDRSERTAVKSQSRKVSLTG